MDSNDLTAVIQGSDPIHHTHRTLEYVGAHGGPLPVCVFEPQTRTLQRRCAIVLFHGGGWVIGRAGQFHRQCWHFAERGMVGIAPQYRVGNYRPRAGVIGGMADCKAAWRWVFDNADELHIDPARIAVGGGSAGGLAAAHICADRDLPQAACQVLINPCLHLGPDGYWPTVARKEPGVRELSPHRHLAAGQPPAIILHGDRDQTIPLQRQRRYAARSEELGNVCRLRIYPGARHAFFNFGHYGGRYYQQTTIHIDQFLVEHGLLPPLQDALYADAFPQGRIPVELVVVYTPGAQRDLTPPPAASTVPEHSHNYLQAQELIASLEEAAQDRENYDPAAWASLRERLANLMY